MDANRVVGERIREQRKRLGMTQERLAHLAEIDRKHMGTIEAGNADPRFKTLIRIAGALAMPIEKLAAGFVFVPSEDSPGRFEFRER
jgi:transcriptional regulator with XRE-family HTH domain